MAKAAWVEAGRGAGSTSLLAAPWLACCCLWLLGLAAPAGAVTASYNYDLTNATLAVVVDEHFHAEAKGKTGVAEAIRAFLSSATLQFLKHGGLNVEFYSVAEAALRPDLTAVMTIGACSDTWRLFRQVEEAGLLHLAITEADCPRLPRSGGVTVPLTERGGDLPQMILDMKVERVLPWKNAIVLYDRTMESKLLDRVLAALVSDNSGSLPSTVSAFNIPTEQADWKRRKRVESVLRSLPVSHLGQRFLVLVASDMVGVVMDVAKGLGLVHPQAQWLYVLSDTSSTADSLAMYTSLLTEGDNVAFASNYTTRQQFCQTGLLCHAREMLRALLLALDRSVQDEQDLATQVSDEEWEAIRPSKEDRTALLLAHVKDLLRTSGTCGNCTAWRLRGSDTWGLSFEKPTHRSSSLQDTGPAASGEGRPSGLAGEGLPAGHVGDSRSAGRVEDGPFSGQGDHGAGHVGGAATAGHVEGGDTAGHVEGGATAGHVGGGDSAGHVGEDASAGHVGEGASAGPAQGGDVLPAHSAEDRLPADLLSPAAAAGPLRLTDQLRQRLLALRGQRNSSVSGPGPAAAWSGEEPVAVQDADVRRRAPRATWDRSSSAEEDLSDDSRFDSRYDPPPLRRPPRPFVRGRVVAVGWWRPREGLDLQDALFPHVAHGFKGRDLPILSYHNPPWQMIVANASGHVIAYKGLVFEIVNELAKNLNFTYTVLFPHQNDAGLSNDTEVYTSTVQDGDFRNAFSLNLSWDKTIQGVRENKVFLGAAAFTITAERKQFVNFTRAISDQSYQLLVVRPRELSRALLFMSPFTAMTWFCIALSVAGIGPVLHWIHLSSPFYEYFHMRGRGGLNSMTNCLWYTYGALLQQGGAYLPDADSGRLVVGTWWLVVLVLVTTYCGNLVAALTFPRIETSISSVETMLERRGEVTWGIRKGSPLIEHMKSFPNPRLAPVLDLAEIHDDEGAVLERVRLGTHLFIDWRVNLLQLMKKDFNQNARCDFSIVNVRDFLDERVGMIMAQDSPYLNIVNEEIRRMQQVGLVEKWLRDYLPKKDRCWVTSNNLEANNHSVNLGDMQGSFFVLFLGFLMAAVLILLECGCRRWHSAKERKVIKPFVP